MDIWNAAWGGLDFAHGFAALVLLWARLVPLFALAPWLAFRRSPSLSVLLASVVGACVLRPLAVTGEAQLTSAGLQLIAACGFELLRGSVLALGCVLPLWVFETNGAIADLLRAQSAGEAELAGLFARAALVLALAASAHLGLLRWFAATLDAAPLGVEVAGWSQNTLFTLVDLVLRAFALGVTLSAPLLLGVWVISVIAGLLARLAPVLSPASNSGLWPAFGVGLLCLSAASVLDQVPSVVQLFGREAARVLSQ